MPAGQLLKGCLSELASADNVYIAYSGGLDSSVLLAAACEEIADANLHAIHINHGISPNSSRWQAHCELTCAQLRIPLHVLAVDVVTSGKGLEQAAREVRYHCFQQLVKKNDVILMAHHLDDQVETVLYRFLRGSGPKGLAGMPRKRQLGQGRLLRPLIDQTRETLEQYAVERGLVWVDDESNQSLAMDRNFLRQRVLPIVEERWPDYRQRICRTANHCKSAQQSLSDAARQQLGNLDLQAERLGSSIALAPFQSLEPEQQQHLLRYWVENNGFSPCSHKIINSVLLDLVTARLDARPLVSWPGGEFRRYRHRLYLLPEWTNDQPTEPVCFQLSSTNSTCFCETGGGFSLTFSPATTTEPILKLSPGDNVQIVTRQGGERCHPHGRQHSTTLKKLLQEYELEPWLRDLAPLIFVNGTLAAVANLFICEGFQCDDEKPGFIVDWFSSPEVIDTSM